MVNKPDTIPAVVERSKARAGAPEMVTAALRRSYAAGRAQLGRRETQLLLGIVGMAAIVRFATLETQSIWTDEGLTAMYMHLPVKQMLIQLPTIDANPPFFYLLEKAFIKVFGSGDGGLRVLSAFAGTLTVPVLYAIGSTVASRRAGLVAALLGLAQPMLWWYSQEARAYALFTFLSAATLLAFAVTVRDRSLWAFACWLLFGALMLTTQFFGVFVLAPQAVWLLVWWRGRRREVLLGLCGLGVVGLGMAITFAQEVDHPGFSQLPLGQRIGQVVPQLLAGPSPPRVAWVVALGLVIVGGALALITIAPGSTRRFARIFAGLVVWGVCGPMLAALIGSDFVLTRNLIPALVPLLVLLGIGFTSPRARWAGPAAGGLAAAVSIATMVAVVADRGLQRIDTKRAIESLGPPTVDRLVLTPGTYVFNYTTPRYVTGGLPLGGDKVPVQEIDVLIPIPGVGEQPCLDGQTCQLFPTTERLGPPAPGFRLFSRRVIQPFTVMRWRAPAPVGLDAADIAASEPSAPGTTPIALFQNGIR